MVHLHQKESYIYTLKFLFLFEEFCFKMPIKEAPPTTWDFDDASSYSNFNEMKVTNYVLDIQPDFETKKIHVIALIDLIAMKDDANKVAFDTRRLTVSEEDCEATHGFWSVKAEDREKIKDDALPNNLNEELAKLCTGDRLVHTQIRSSTELGTGIEVDLGANFSAGSKLTIVTRYTTSPDADAVQWLAKEQTAGKQHPYMFTQCQAIHARTLLPTQDTPRVKTSYSAAITVDAPLRALMSAERLNDGKAIDESGSLISCCFGEGKGAEGKVTYHFRQKEPIPSYLICIAVGALKSKRIGPRSHVWSEEEDLERCHYEFDEVTEKFISTGEKLFGPYIWGNYDLLVLPPSFPYGGMENPNLTFVTPTLLAGDRSLTDVVAHEVAHSWFGNFVTNEGWEDFWYIFKNKKLKKNKKTICK